MSDSKTEILQLTNDEWESIAILRAAAGVGLQHGVLALPDRVKHAIDVARGVMDRTRYDLLHVKI